MNDSAYQKLKKQNGEAFARTLRDHHNGLLDIPDIDLIVRHAGRDATALLPYLMTLLAVNHNTPSASPEDPFVLLDRAGYRAFHADTLEKQNSIKDYFAASELLCTFNDAARYQNYHIVHAVKKDADTLKRADFTGREEREDAYGTSVISIQMLKSGGFISIKNRYNHTVSACDNTFGSNPDKIIDGLSSALKAHFNVDFSASQSPLPEGYVLLGTQIFKYHTECNNIYYGNQAWVQNGQIRTVDRDCGDALFDGFYFQNKQKMLAKIDSYTQDSFALDFNRAYGGNRGLCVDRQGNLTLNGEILIGAEKSQIKTLHLPALKTMSNECLSTVTTLIRFSAPALTTMGNDCFYETVALVNFEAPALTTMGKRCFWNARALTDFTAPALTTMGSECLVNADSLTNFAAPALTTMNSGCLANVNALTNFSAPALKAMGNQCLYHASALIRFEAPALVTIGNKCLWDVRHLTHFQAHALTTMGEECLFNTPALNDFNAPALTTLGSGSLHRAPKRTKHQIHLPRRDTSALRFSEMYGG